MRIYKKSVGIGLPSESFYLISAGGVMYSIEETGFHLNGNGNATMERYNIPDLGYEDKNKEINYQIQDHLGNLRLSYTVAHCPTCSEYNCATVDVQYQINYIAEYMAYGGLLREFVRNGTASEKFLSTGHERDKQTGWDYRQARYYDADLGRFLAVDPMAGAAPGWSPYRYAFDNPIRYIDPTGMLEDDYGLDKDGNITLIRENDDKTDKLIALNDKGAETDKSIEVEKGLLNNVKNTKDSRGTSYDYMKVGNNETATKLFEFVSENSQVEWSQVKYGTKSNYIATSHNPTSESGGVDLMYKLLTQGYAVREHIHSHPDRKTSNHGPSGFHPKDRNSGDRELGEWINKYYPNKGIKLKVYEVPIKKYIEYNHKGIVK